MGQALVGEAVSSTCFIGPNRRGAFGIGSGRRSGRVDFCVLPPSSGGIWCSPATCSEARLSTDASLPDIVGASIPTEHRALYRRIRSYVSARKCCRRRQIGAAHFLSGRGLGGDLLALPVGLPYGREGACHELP